jgi:HlyD family secretion protein
LLNLTNAQLNYNTTLSTLNWYTGQSTPLDADTYQANLAVAQAQLADAQRTLDRLKNGPDAATVAAAQAKVDLAQSSVNTMYIIAPFDGEVLAVKTSPDILINTGDAAVELVDRNTLTVDAQVDETDISRVSIGNPAQITMDALPGLKLTGKVSAIDPIGTTVNGLVKYTVTVAIDPTDQAVLFGATTNVTLMTSNPHTTLAVPLGAVQNDSQGEYVLRVSSDGSPERVAVQSGAIVGDVVAVTGNLKDGDRVEVGYSGNNSQQQPGNFRGPFGIGG